MGLALMTIATYDMIRTLDNAKNERKVEDDIALANQIEAQNGFNSKDGMWHAIPNAEKDNKDNRQSNNGYLQEQLTTQGYLHLPAYTQVSGEWPISSSGQEANPYGGIDEQRQNEVINSNRDSNGLFRQGTRQTGGQAGQSNPPTKFTFPDAVEESEFEQEVSTTQQSGSNGNYRKTRGDYWRRVRRETAGQLKTNETLKSDYEKSNEKEGLNEWNKTYRGVLIGCQVVTIIVGFVQLVSACGIVCSCSPVSN